MQLYDATNKRALCQEIDRLCDSDDTSYPRLDKTARLNDALETVVGWLINADGTWQFDDENYSTNPIGTGNLVSGQYTYSFADKFLDLEEVEILDLSGIYRRIDPFDPSELEMSYEEYYGITTSAAPLGFPQFYDKVGNTIKLSHAPTSDFVTLANGLRVRFKRTASLFTPASNTSADTTVPGFASPFHIILAYMAAIPYCATYKKDRVPLYLQKVGDTRPATGLKKDLLQFYANREKDVRKIMRGKKILYI